MDNSQLETFIIDRLASAVNPDDIILEICNQTNLSWAEAEERVNKVQSEHEYAVTRQQSPLLTVIALGLFIGGFALIGVSVFTLVGIIQFYTQADLFYTDMAAFLLYLFQYASGSLGMIGLGLAMILGSLAGMRRVWAAILNI